MNLSMYALEYKLNTSFSRFLNLVIIIMVPFQLHFSLFNLAAIFVFVFVHASTGEYH